MEIVNKYKYYGDEQIDINNIKVDTAESVKDVINLILDINKAEIEKFGIVCLDNRRYVVDVHILAVGTVDSVNVTWAKIMNSAASLGKVSVIILFHNHPGGTLIASENDISYTKIFKKLGEEQGIPILDHIIVCGDNYYSMKEKGDVDFSYDPMKAVFTFD